MESGIVDQEKFSHLLQSISQRRRSGVLKLELEEGSTTIYFHLGKIVDLLPSGINPVEVLRQRLVRSGDIPENSQLQAANYAELVEKLRGAGVTGRVVEAEFFGWAVQQGILDRLYSLDLSRSVAYSFGAQMLDPNDFVAQPISVGQLLLDFVSLEATRERFQEVFSQARRVQQAKEASPSFSGNEELLFELIASRPFSLAELRVTSLLSSYHFEEALLGLYDQGYISAGLADDSAEAEEAPTLESVTAALDAAIETEEQQLESAEAAVLEAPAENAGVAGEGDQRGDRLELSGLPWLVRLNILSSQILQRESAPRLLALVFFLAALFAPFLFWRELFRAFTE